MELEDFMKIDWHRGNRVRLSNGKEYPVKKVRKQRLILWSEEYEKYFMVCPNIVEEQTDDYAEPQQPKEPVQQPEPKKAKPTRFGEPVAEEPKAKEEPKTVEAPKAAAEPKAAREKISRPKAEPVNIEEAIAEAPKKRVRKRIIIRRPLN